MSVLRNLSRLVAMTCVLSAAAGSAVLLSAGSAVLLSAGSAVAQERKNPFESSKSWAFQLRNLGPKQQAKIAASPYDVVVIDSLLGAEDEEGDGKTRFLAKEEIAKMKRKPDGSRRLVIKYFSIGESENYRHYWRPEWNKARPSWMSKENKEWKGNYLVQYWNPTWQHIIFGAPESYADMMLDLGFDGFYLDRVDAYYYFGDNKQARERMVDFVSRLAKHIRSRKPDVGILGQNAEELLEYPAYVEAIDGIAKESPIYGIKGADVLNPRDDITHTTNLLQTFQRKGKKVFVVEYLRKPETIADAIKRTRELGWVLYMGPRGLAQLSGATPEGYSSEQVKATEAWSAPPVSAAKPVTTAKAKAK